MKNFKILTLLTLILFSVGGAGIASAQSIPDCSSEGPNRMGLVWSNGEFSQTSAPYAQQTATLYLFNPSGGDVRGWELSVEFPATEMYLVNTSLRGDAVNVGVGNSFIVGLGSPLTPDASGAVALADFTFLPIATNPADIYANPSDPASIPGSLAILTGPDSTLEAAYPIGGVGYPIGNLNSYFLDYCTGGPANLPPTATLDVANTNEDEAVTFNITDNDNDPDGTLDLASVQFTSSPSGGGIFVSNGDGTVTFTPAPDHNGIDGLSYTIADNLGAVSNQAAISVTIDPVDDPPVAVSEVGFTDEDVSLVMDLAANDYDIDSPLNVGSMVLGEAANGGTMVDHGDGTVTFTPLPDFNGFDYFSYTIADSFGVASVAVTDTVFIASVNDPPVAYDDTPNALEDVALTFNIIDNDEDIDGIIDLGSVQFIGTPSAGGTFVDNGDGTVTYTPLPDYFGADGLSYTVTDNEGDISNEAVITVTIEAVDDIPVAVPENDFTDEDVSVTMDLAVNDYDIDSLLDVGSIALGEAANGGSLVNHGDGTVTFTPLPDFNGFDYFSYTIADDFGVVSLAVTDTVFIASVNDPPVAYDDTPNTPEDVALTFNIIDNDEDIDGIIDLGSVQFIGTPSAGGTFVDNGDGTVTYTPLPDYFGADGLSYTVTDNEGDISNEAVITVTVEAVDDIPVAMPENDFTDEDISVTMDLALNDYDIDSPLNVASMELGEPANGGTLVDHGDGTATFTPLPNFFGFDYFSYTIADNFGVVSLAVTDTVFIASINDPPVAVSDTVITFADIPVAIEYAANDYDIDGYLDLSSLSLGTPSQGGSFVDDGDGTVIYTPEPGFTQEETISYFISDNQGEPCDVPAHIIVMVQPGQNQAPVIGDIPDQLVALGQEFPPLNLNDFVSDEQSPETLNWQATGWGELSVVITNNSAQVKTADPAWFGSQTITFVVTDDGGLTDSANVTFTVNNGFDLSVEIVVNGQDAFYAGTAPGATVEFDPEYDMLISDDQPPLVFDSPPGMENYAYVRHLFQDYSFDIATTYVDDELYEIPFNRYRPIPLGEFCIYECIWNDNTQQYDCGNDCQYEIEGGKFYSLIWVPGGTWADIMLVEEDSEAWLRADTRDSFDATGEVQLWNFEVSYYNPGTVPATSALQFNTSFMPSDGINLKLWDDTTGTFFDLDPDFAYSYEIPSMTNDIRTFTLFVGTPDATADTDGDGVLDDVDQCPAEDASFFDRDGDGCIDPVISGRHIEYWAAGTFPLAYYIHQDGAPGISDGSDMTAVQEGFEAWTEIAGTEITVDYLGTTADPVANAFDGINTVTFNDGEFPFPSGVIAVGLSTSYLVADYDNGVRPGQIIDTDMIFNPVMPFRTDTQGPGEGTYIKGVVVHEAGHMLGLSHSGVQSSTMFYVLPPDTTAVSLEKEDRQAMFKAYYDQASFAGTSHLQGTVTDGLTGLPVSGAIVYVISTADDDTVGSDFTLPQDGSFHFIGLPDGSYNLAIHPLNGSSTIGYLYPGNINALINGTANTLFLPEYWDAGESNNDDPTAFTPVFVAAGTTAEAHFITNIDLTGPSIIAVSPESGATEVPIGAAILFRCDEAINPASLVGNFNFQAQSGGGFLLGNASLVEDGRTLAYVPTVTLDFNTTYLLEVGAGLEDLYGNTMGTDFATTFTTEQQPPVAMNNLIPRKGVSGSILVINGDGFGGEPGDNIVTYGGDEWPVLDAGPNQLVVQVPLGATPSTANIQVVASGIPSNELSFTILHPVGEAHGMETAAVDLFALPRQVEASPDGDIVYIATSQGLTFVDVDDPSSPVAASLLLGNGLTGMAVTPDGQRVFAISSMDAVMYRLGTNPVAELESLPLDFRPQGITIDPSGQWAYLATDYREIQIWDIDEGSLTFQSQVGTLMAPGSNLKGAMATDPAGNYLLALDGSGQLLVFDLTSFELEAEIAVLPSAHDVVVDPGGLRAYVTDETGYVSIISLTSFTNVLDIPTGGALHGAAIDPMGSFLYSVNHQLDNLDAIDLRSGSPTYRTISARLPQQINPVDVDMSPDGVYAYVIVESSQRLSINTVGAGPLLNSLSRRSGPVGAKVVLAGLDFTGGSVSFNGTPAIIEQSSDTALTVAVPIGATSGPVMVLGDEPGQISNAIGFEVLDESPAGGLHLTATAQPAGTPALTGALTTTSGDDVVAIGGQNGRIHLLDINPTSMYFNQFIGETASLGGPVNNLVATPDGMAAFATTNGASGLYMYDINQSSTSFGDLLSFIELDGAQPRHLAVSPDGRYVLVADPLGSSVHVVNWADGTALVTNLGAAASTIAFHPAGLFAYVSVPGQVLVLDMNPASPDFGNSIGSMTIADIPAGLVFHPDGSRCYVLTGPSDVSLVTLDTSDPVHPLILESLDLFLSAEEMNNNLTLSPAGDRALLNIRFDGLFLVDLASGETIHQADLVADNDPLGFGFSTDGQHVYLAASENGLVSTFDFISQQQMNLVWGNEQTGEINEQLGSSLRVRVVDPVSGEGLAGVPVTFAIDTSGKNFTSAPSSPLKPGKFPTFASLKSANHVGLNKGTPDGNKSGGELIDDAVAITGLPFTDTGNTSDNTDDYDEICPYDDPGSPDVVYSWIADFSGGVSIDLCGSGYDTKVYVYADALNPGNPWACNDDAYPLGDPCGAYVSRIDDMVVFEGTTYYIVVDGWGGDSGDYVINMDQNYESSPWGFFVTDDPAAHPTTLTTGTDEQGFANVNWSLGMALGLQAVDVNTMGATGSPFQFTATAVTSLVDVDFALVESLFAPASGALDVAVNTAIQITFSKAVNPTSVNPDNFYLSADGGATPLSSVMGFASGNTTASLTPEQVLDYGTVYTVVIGPDIFSDLGEPLTNPQSFTFTSISAPPSPELFSVNPPGAAVLTPVMLAGVGFNPDPLQNTVYFGGVPATVTSVDPDFILTRVPLGLGAGMIDIQVDVGGQLTNAMPFNVLEPTTEGADEVVLRVPTGSATRSATVSPDGAVLFAIAPESDLVIPIELVDFTTLPSIPVGDMPWAISGHPDGDLVYVANRMSGDVSVIDTDPDSPTYQQTISTIEVGTQPVDIMVTPAGDRVLVANEESQDLSIIDCDSQSASFNYVINRVPVGSSVKTVTVTPDGARIYLGTDEGYIIIGSLDYGVIRRVGMGTSVKTVTISPDGALLVLVDTVGEVVVVDIAQGSPSEDQVVARLPRGAAVKTATVSPDGARVYAVMEENDIINVFALEIASSIGANGEPDPRPVPDLVLVNVLTAGENPQSVIFDPAGIDRFFVSNAGDNTISVFAGDDVVSVMEDAGTLAGHITAECSEPVTALRGIRVGVFAAETGELVETQITDQTGSFSTNLPAGNYTLSMVTPQGFAAGAEEQAVQITEDRVLNSPWALECLNQIPDQRSMAWWKYQLAIVLRGWGTAEVDESTFCGYLDVIANNFNAVGIYQPPVSGESSEKLDIARELFNFRGEWSFEARAKQQLLALQLNVAGSLLTRDQVISEDRATVDQAIAYVSYLLNDNSRDNDQIAWSVTRSINMGAEILSGIIGGDQENDFYSPIATHFHLDQNYPNPFNPECRIRFGVPKAGRVQVKIFDVSGRLVHTLVDESLASGTYTKVWNGTDNRGMPAASGVYFYRMMAGTFVETKKMLLMK